VRPLAIGAGRLIWPEAKAAGIKRRALNDAMKRHTGSNLYLERLAVPGAVRVHLDGAAAASVTDEHREGAIAMLAAKRAQNRSTVGSFDRGPDRAAKWHEREHPESS
jgi:sRNA-binding protein